MHMLAIVAVVKYLSRTEPFATHIKSLPRPIVYAAIITDRLLSRRLS